MNDESKKPSRFSQIQQILTDIQGKNQPEYQGYGAFWMDLTIFKTAVIYGQRMIWPATDDDTKPTNRKSCCGGGGDTESLGPAEAAVLTYPPAQNNPPNCWPSGGASGAGGGNDPAKPSTLRSSQSGIIKGLRGQAPFDNSQFPPLLWEASRQATASEIAFIAQWIDDGCPATDELPAPAELHPEVVKQFGQPDRRHSLACGDIAHPLSTKCTNIDKGATKGLNVRKEISTLTPTELDRFKAALSCMYQYNGHWQDERSFDFWARMHANSCEHGWEQFLPWHRLYLYFFEQQLQDFDPLITLPYWSWPDYADANRTSYNTKQLDQGVIPAAYRCWLDNKAVDQLNKSGLFTPAQLAQLKAVADSGVTFNSGVRLLNQAKIPYALSKNKAGEDAWSDQTRAIYNQLRRINPLWFPNRWPGSVGSPTQYPTKANIDNILAVNNWYDFGGGPDYDHHFGDLEKVHNGMHNFSGGANPYFDKKGNPQNPENPQSGWMTDNRVTAFDPIFWAHHSNVDRLWARWQELHPGVLPDELTGVLAPWSLTVNDTLSVKKLGYEYMRDSFHYETASDMGMTLFKSAKTGVRPQVLNAHRKAEIRLHRVQVSNLPNATIRVFLNQDDACCQTDMTDNAHYVGEITTFSGSCYGGPGHCDMPLPKTRSFDVRQLHHHEPRNFRLDATEAVHRLMAKGETDLSIHLVVAGIDGQPIDNALFFDGVSLNFMD